MDIISHFRSPILVVSAFGGITDALYRFYEYDESRMDKLRDLLLMHLGILWKYNIEAHPEISIQDSSILDQDAYVSYGEKMSAFTLARFLTGNGIPAAPIYTDEAGLIVEEISKERTVDLEGSRAFFENIARVETSGKVPVVTGFFGIDRYGKTRILGRNSSDYSAVAVAAILGIREVILIKDVPGIYMNLEDRTSIVNRIDYETALRIVDRGSKVVHRAALRLAMKMGMNLLITSPENLESGTVIGDLF